MTEIILGTAQLCSSYGVMQDAANRDPDTAGEILRVAAKNSVSCLDTAPAYGCAETTIGRSGLRFRVHTKLDAQLSPEDSISKSLRDLGMTQVEIVYLHDPDAVFHQQSGTFKEAIKLRGGPFTHLGASVYSSDQIAAALSSPAITALQVPLNLLTGDQFVEHCAFAASAGVRIYARSAFLQGALLSHPDSMPRAIQHLRPQVLRVRGLAERFDKPVGALALGSVLRHEFLSGLVIGAATPSQLNETLSYLPHLPLPPALLAELDEITVTTEAAIDPRKWIST